MKSDATATTGLSRDPVFIRLWLLGGILAMMRWLDALVLSVFVYELTGSATRVALVFFFRMAPQLLLGLVIGLLADQFSRKTLLIISFSALSLVAATLLLLISSGQIQYWHIAVAVAVNGIFLTFEFPVRRGLLGELIAPEYLAKALGWDIATANSMRVIGPLLGGFLLSLTGAGGAYTVAAAMFAAAAVIASTLPYRRQPQPGGHRTQPLQGLLAGLRYIRQSVALSSVLMITVVMNLCIFPYISMVPVVAKEVFQADAFWIGVLSGMEGTAAVLGSLWLAGRLTVRVYLPIFFYSSLLLIICVLLFANSGHYPVAAVTLFCGGLGLAGFTTMQTTILVTGSSTAMRGRVLGALALCIGAQPLGALQLALLTSFMAPQMALLVMGLEGLMIVLLAGWWWPQLRMGKS